METESLITRRALIWYLPPASLSQPGNTNTTDDGSALGAPRHNNRTPGPELDRRSLIFYPWNLHTRRHTPTPTTISTTAASSMCYFANCNPGQDNKMASRHFVNISVLARSAPGRLLTDGCVDWFFFYYFFFFLLLHESSALVCQTAWEQVEASAQGGEKGSLMQISSLKSSTKHLSGGGGGC